MADVLRESSRSEESYGYHVAVDEEFVGGLSLQATFWASACFLCCACYAARPWQCRHTMPVNHMPIAKRTAAVTYN